MPTPAATARSEKIGELLTIIGMAPTAKGIQSSVSDIWNDKKGIHDYEHYMNVANGSLGLISQVLDSLKSKAVVASISAVAKTSYFSIATLAIDVSNAVMQVNTNGKVSSGTMLGIGSGLTGLASAALTGAAAVALGPELLVAGAVVGVISLALSAAGAMDYEGAELDLNPIINAVNSLKTSYLSLMDTLDEGLLMAAQNGDGTFLGFAAALQGIPVKDGILEKQIQEMLSPTEVKPTVAAINPPNHMGPEYSASEKITVHVDSQPAIIKPGLGFAGGAQIEAVVVGVDLVLKGAGDPITIKNWKTGQNFEIVLPDGTVLDKAHFQATLTPAWDKLSFAQAYQGADFVNVVNSLGSGYTNSAAMHVGGAAAAWERGLNDAVYVGQSDYNTPMYSSTWTTGGMTAEYDTGAVPIHEARAGSWGTVTYNFWLNPQGQYEFAITSHYSGIGGHSYSQYNESTGEVTYFSVDRVAINWGTQYGTYTTIPAVSKTTIFDSHGAIGSDDVTIVGEYSDYAEGLFTKYTSDGAGNDITMQYSRGVLMRQTEEYADGSTSIFSYTTAGSLLSHWSKDVAGNVVYSVPGSDGSNTIHRYNVDGTTKVLQFNADKSFRETGFDATGKVVQKYEVSSTGASSSYSLSPEGTQYFSTDDGKGSTVNKTVEPDGTVQVSYSDATQGKSGNSVSRPDKSEESWQYSEEGTEHWITDGAGFSARTITKANGDRVMTMNDYGSRHEQGSFADGSYFDKVEYADGLKRYDSRAADGSGSFVQEINGSKYVEHYGSGGVVTYRQQAESNGYSDTTSYTNGVMRLKEVKYPSGSSLSIKFDANGEKISEDNVHPDGGSVLRTFQQGVMTSELMTHADGSYEGYTYDEMGNVLTRWSSDAQGITTVQGQDAAGATFIWTFGANNVVTSKQTITPDGSTTSWYTDSTGLRISLTDDGKGNLTFGEGVQASSVSLAQVDGDLVISIVNCQQNIKVENFFEASGAPKLALAVHFADGSAWDSNAAVEADSKLVQGKGAQLTVLSAQSASQVDIDPAFAPDAVKVSLNAQGQLHIAIEGTEDSITLLNWSNPAAAQATVVSFSNDINWGYAELQQELNQDAATASITFSSMEGTSYHMQDLDDIDTWAWVQGSTSSVSTGEDVYTHAAPDTTYGTGNAQEATLVGVAPYQEGYMVA